MKAVVTGATGHIGRYTVDTLAQAGFEVVAVSRSGTQPELPFGATSRVARVQTLAADLSRDASVGELSSVLEKDSVLVHLAAWHPEQTANTGPRERRQILETNVHGTARALEAARNALVCAVVYASSFEVYGEVTDEPITERSRVHPITDYGASKLSGEDHLLAFAYEEKTRVVALRMPAVYGPGEHTPRALPNFLKSVARGELPAIHGDGADLRDQLHVMDAARAIVLAARSDASGIFNVADGQPHSIRELAEVAIAVAGLSGAPLERPRVKPRRDYHMSIDKARAELGFAPKVELRDGMAQQLEWLRQLKRP